MQATLCLAQPALSGLGAESALCMSGGLVDAVLPGPPSISRCCPVPGLQTALRSYPCNDEAKALGLTKLFPVAPPHAASGAPGFGFEFHQPALIAATPSP